MSALRNIFIVLFFLFLTVLSYSFAQKLNQPKDIPDKPKEEKYLFDFAHVVDQQQRAIREMLEDFQDTFGIELIVVTVDSLGGDSINNYAVELFEKWRIGDKYNNKGLLLLLAKQELLIRLEVSYGLEGIFTDAFCGYIERDQLLPFFKSGLVGPGLQGTVEAIINKSWEAVNKGELTLSQKETVKLPGERGRISGGAGAKKRVTIGGATAEFDVLEGPLRNRYSAQETPEDVVEKFLELLEKRITDPTLEIYTEGDRIDSVMRGVPRNPYQCDNFARTIRDGLPYEIIIKDDLALVKFRKDAKRSCPLTLKRSAEGWQLDESAMWRIFMKDYKNNCTMRNVKHEYLFAFKKASPRSDYRDDSFVIKRKHFDTLEEEIRYYKNRIKNNPDDYMPYLQLAEVYFFDCCQWKKSFGLYEQGIKRLTSLDKKAAIHFYLASLCMYWAQRDRAAKHYQKYTELKPDDWFGYYKTGWAYLNANKPKEAIKYYNQSLKLTNNSGSLGDLAYAYAMLKDFEKAEKYLKEFEDFNPAPSTSSIKKIKAYIKKQKKKQ